MSLLYFHVSLSVMACCIVRGNPSHITFFLFVTAFCISSYTIRLTIASDTNCPCCFACRFRDRSSVPVAMGWKVRGKRRVKVPLPDEGGPRRRRWYGENVVIVVRVQ